MGKRGPAKQPSALQELRGNPGKRAANKREPKPKGKLPACPKHLQGASRKAWQAFSKQLTDSGIATKMDAVALEMLCNSYALYLDAMAKVLQLGPIWIEKGESKIPKFAYSPFWAVKNREWEQVLKILREFGMTPSSRTSVNAGGESEEGNPFEAFLQQSANAN